MTTPRRRRPRLSSVLLGAIVAVSAAVRLWALDFGLPHTQTRPDETQIIDVTLYFLRGDFQPPFYDYPWLFMWVATGGYLVYCAWGVLTGAFASVADLVATWPVDWEPFFLITRAISAAAGTATVAVVYRLARKLWDETTALLSALFLGLTFIHARDSHFGTTDVTMTLLIVGSVSLLVSAHFSRRPSLFALAGLVGGLATATKYAAVFLVAPLVASQIIHVIDSPGRRRAAALDGRVVWFGAAFAGGLAFGVPFVVADSERFWGAMQLLADSMRQGQGAITPDNGWLHHLTQSLRYGMTLPLLLASLAGAVALFVSNARVAALLLSFPIVYFVVAGSFRNLFFRYMIPIVPFLTIAAAVLVATIARRFSPARLAPALAGVVLVLPSAVNTWEFNRVASEKDNRVLLAEWFAENVPPGDSVVQSGSIYGYAQLDTRVWVHWTWDRNRRMFMVQNRPAEGRPDWIVVQESPLPSMTQDAIRGFLKEDYQFAWRLTAFTPDARRVYDLQDAFFVPFTRFGGVKRPGPNFSVFKRSTARFRHDSRIEP